MSNFHTYQIGGMRCQHCSQSVTTTLSSLPGILSVEVDLPNGTVTIEMEENGPSTAVIKSAIEDIGFDFLG